MTESQNLLQKSLTYYQIGVILSITFDIIQLFPNTETGIWGWWQGGVGNNKQQKQNHTHKKTTNKKHNKETCSTVK